ncbi:MAG: hypothetical protein AB7O52_12875 [Planctomycetota bacterium]
MDDRQVTRVVHLDRLGEFRMRFHEGVSREVERRGRVEIQRGPVGQVVLRVAVRDDGPDAVVATALEDEDELLWIRSRDGGVQRLAHETDVEDRRQRTRSEARTTQTEEVTSIEIHRGLPYCLIDCGNDATNCRNCRRRLV